MRTRGVNERDSESERGRLRDKVGLEGFVVAVMAVWLFTSHPQPPFSLSDRVSNKQSLILATSARLKTTGIVGLAFVYRKMTTGFGPDRPFFLSLSARLLSITS